MWVELQLPEEIATMLPLTEEGYRGPSEITVIVDAIGAVSNVVTVGQVLSMAPELARRIRAWRQNRAGRTSEPEPEEPRLVIKAPGVHIEIDLPPNVQSQRIAATLIQALQPELNQNSQDR